MMTILAVPYDPSLDLSDLLNVEALEGAFNEEKALVGTFSVIVKSSRIFV